MAPSFELVGRSREQARLVDFAARLREGPGALLVRGEPGIGKTVLWREGIAAAQREGIRALIARCAEAEMPVPLGAVSDLLDPVFHEVSDELVEPQRRALAAALGNETAAGGRPDRLTLLRALVAALRALADDGGLLLAIDDVQWLDPASASVLSFAVRRIGDEPIGVLASLRGATDEPDPLGLADAFQPEAFAELSVGSLGLRPLQQLLAQRSEVRIPRAKVAAVHAASGGNPMFALEFARAAERERPDPQAPLPVPSSLQELVSERVRALPENTRPLLELVSAIERPTPALLAKALGQADIETLVHDAVSVGAIAVDLDGVVRFTHPLLGATVYFGMPSRRRRDVHLQAAALVDNLEQEARHLALATFAPDEAIGEVVERAAYAAAERGAPDAAAILSAEAERLTPPDDETARVRRTFAGAGFLTEAGDVRAAQTRVEPLLHPSIPAGVRAQALVIRSDTEHEDRTLIRTFLREAIDIAPDPRIRWQAWIRYAQQGGWVSGDAATAAASAREALHIAVDLNDEDLITASKAALAFYEAVRGNRELEFDTYELEASEHLARAAPWQITPAISVGARLLWAGELDRARDVLRNEYEELVRRGSILRLVYALLPALFDLEWRAGDWSAAEAYEKEGQVIFEDTVRNAHVFYYARILLFTSLGGVDEARDLAAAGQRIADRQQDTTPLRTRWALGHLELSRSDATAAWQALEGLPEALESVGIHEPGWQPILPDVVETLVALGRLDEAEAVLGQLEQQAAALRHKWATPAALRCRALLLLAREQSDEAAAAAEQAGAAFAELGFPLDRARALLAAGAARRRAGQRTRAADLLKSAIEILDELGAPLWREQAEHELRRASPRPRRDRELTSAERRVAALVAQGQTNREVAAQLFTTIRTVEAHLTRIYRKLGIRSRTQLARAIADGSLHLEED
jgi:DNA-binding NarL/FixJ family response regulator